MSAKAAIGPFNKSANFDNNSEDGSDSDSDESVESNDQQMLESENVTIGHLIKYCQYC